MTRYRNPRPALLRLALVVCAGGCAGVAVDPLGMQIVEDVSPIEPMVIDRVCVQVDTGVKQKFTDGLFDTLRSLGMKTQSMQTAFAGECPHWVRYHATWGGFPPYLVSARVEVYQANSRLGHAVYDATDGGARPDRYGSAIGKVRPLIEGMFHHVQRESAQAE